MKILDISKYQPNVDYAKVAPQIDGVILRCGLTGWGAQVMEQDSCFEKHYNGFKAVGVPIGVYYYSAADSVAVAKKEAEFCLSILKDKQFELPIYYDVENNERQGKLSKLDLTNITDIFCSTLEKAGYFVGYYSYTAWLRSKFDVKLLSKKFSLWKADYRLAFDKSIACDMHQYTSSGTLNGIGGRVDLNNCFVDFPSIIKAKGLNGFGKTPPQVKPVDSHPIRLEIGFASGGDIKTIGQKLAELCIKCTEIKGFLITDKTVSVGDQQIIKALCDSLEIPIKEYVPIIEQPNCTSCAELEKLKKSNEKLQEELRHTLEIFAKSQTELSAFKTALNQLLNTI